MKQLGTHVHGPWALVTGAASGIGEGFARQAAAAGDLGIGLVVSNPGACNPGPLVSLAHERLRQTAQLNAITHLDLAHHQRTAVRSPLVNDKQEIR
jgi:hypothetical protein